MRLPRPEYLPDPQTRQPFCLQWLAASLGLLALFCEPRSFVFNSLQPLLPKCGGWGFYLPLPTFRSVFALQDSSNPLSHPLRQYREPIAPTYPPRHHCQDAPNRISCAARLPADRWNKPWRPSIGKNSIISNAASCSSPSSRPYSSSCWPAAWPSSCIPWSLSIPTPPTSGLSASPFSVSARSRCSSSAIYSSASAPLASSSSKFLKSSSATSSCACKPAPICSKACRTSTISGIALPWSIAAP